MRILRRSSGLAIDARAADTSQETGRARTTTAEENPTICGKFTAPNLVRGVLERQFWDVSSGQSLKLSGMPALPDPDTAVGLPVDRLAMELLQVLDDYNSKDRNSVIGLEVELHWPRFVIQGASSPRVGSQRYRQVMSEAFDWLQRNGLIARDAVQSDSWFVRTAKGKQIAEANDGLHLLEVDKLLAIELHPSLTAKQVRETFARGDVDQAVWAAVKQVEVSVRQAAGADNSRIGTKLMAWAFKPGAGPLHDDELEAGEQAGIMALYQGLIGTFKNPSSHRHVDFDDPVEAAEIILFADLLLRMLDRLSSGNEATT